jgi:hypothetical protein
MSENSPVKVTPLFASPWMRSAAAGVVTAATASS